MPGRELIYGGLINNISLADVVGDRIYQAGSLGVGGITPKPDPPYILFNQLPSVPYREVRHTSSAVSRTYQVYVYSRRGDYDYIDNILALVRETVLSVRDQKEKTTGARCIDVRWLGDSQDIVDDREDYSYKFITFQLVMTQ